MCGIVGIYNYSNNSYSVEKKIIEKMRDTMVHRGPDGSGCWISDDKKIGFGHRRLAIIDLSEKAHQPMSNSNGSIWLTFNGEIYNHAEIRKDLESKYTWKTDHSDTEVIIHAYEEWGIDAIKKFRGMFSFALWDNSKKELYLVRDRIGIKPLYYSLINGRIIFASEIKALLQDPDLKRGVNEEALYHYLSFLTTPAPNTLFSGVKKIPGGTWLRIKKSGEIKEHRYWDVFDNVKDLSGASEDEIAQMILEELDTAVKYRKESDVPVGVFLSGGIDSSTNAALFSKGATNTIKTFTIGYQGNYQTYQNEIQYAKKMAQIVNAEYYEKLLTIDDLIDFLPEMVKLQDEPIADPVCVPVYYVSKLARENGVIVCQVGEGADELFWGYPKWKKMLQLQKMSNIPYPRIFMKMGLKFLKGLHKDKSQHYEYLRRSAYKEKIFWGGAEAFNENYKRSILSNRLKKGYADLSSWEVLSKIHQRFIENTNDPSILNWMSYLDLNLRLPELLLMRVDKMSMGVSLEGRVPFLDHKFVELAMSIPQKIKTKNGVLKYILKKAVRGIVPDELIDRKKQGFGVPVYEWLFDKLGKNVKNELDSFCKKTDYFNKSEIDKLVQIGSRPLLWYLYNFALWWKEYIE